MALDCALILNLTNVLFGTYSLFSFRFDEKRGAIMRFGKRAASLLRQAQMLNKQT